jgi:hypothetical protein
VHVEHGLLARKLDVKVNSLVRTQGERQPIKKRQNVFSFEISDFSLQNFPTRKMKCSKNNFLNI